MAQDDRVSKLVGLLLSAAGLTGGLVGLGYTVRFAQGDLLGVSTYDPERAGYLLAAGDLIVHTFFLMLNWPTLVALLVGSVLVAALAFIKQSWTAAGSRRDYLALVLVALCATHLTFFVLPVVQINNLLFDKVCTDRYAAVSRLIKWRTEGVWKNIVCSATNQYVVPSCGKQAPAAYREALDYSYTAAVLIGGILCAVGWGVFSWDLPEQGTTETLALWEWSRFLLALSLLLVVVGCAYLYGKTVQSTHFPRAKIIFAKDVLVGKQAEESSFFVIGETDQKTTLFDPDADVLWFARNSAVDIEKPNELPDLLGARVENYYSKLKACQ
jgi:hypothetical protein